MISKVKYINIKGVTLSFLKEINSLSEIRHNYISFVVNINFRTNNNDLSSKIDGYISFLTNSKSNIKELGIEDAKKELVDTKEVIKLLYSSFDKLEQSIPSLFKEVKKKVNLLYTEIYKFESILHLKAYSDVKVSKTPTEILDLIKELNRRNFGHK